MNEVETEALGRFLLDLKTQGYTLIVVEHHMDLIMGVCDRIVVLNSAGDRRRSARRRDRQRAGARGVPGQGLSVALLEVGNLGVRYDSIEAVRGISFSVDEGEIVAFIGANGAGKSSTLLALSGLVRPWSGAVRFAGRDITRARAGPDRPCGGSSTSPRDARGSSGR